MRVRKKPVEVEAERLTEENFVDISEWCNGLVRYDDLNGDPTMNIYTLEGTMNAYVGDWIIKGVNGEFYPCKHDIFCKTYDVVSIEEEPAKPNIDIEVVSVKDEEDGSASIVFDMSPETLRIFAKQGLLTVLRDEAQRILKEHGKS